MKKKLLTVFVVLMSLSLLLTACGGAAAKPTSAAAAKKPAVAAPAKAAPVAEADKGQYEPVAKSVAAAAGLTDYTWEAYTEPAADSTWEDTLKYYSDQLASVGWAGTGAVSDIENGKVGVFADADGNKFVLAWVKGADNAEILALFGK